MAYEGKELAEREADRLQIKLARFQYLINALGYLKAAQKGFTLERDIHNLLQQEIREVVPETNLPVIPELVKPQ